MKSIGVFCGANHGQGEVYQKAAAKLGSLMAAQQIALVFGGGKVGLMGTIADAILAGGGQAIGVIPQSLVDREVAHTGLSELHVVQTMHERKALMAARSDAFIAMPGGFGTLDEVNEIITWNQLGIIRKPVAFYNVNGYFNKFMEMIDHGVAEGFIKPAYRDSLIVEEDAAALLRKVVSYADAASESGVDFKRI
ncbi:TIGR00730 family Rossman fold protein [Pontibacter diazotrophicus]|uniref:Cytokinin riboside 5'-monophosphate phosphoribohydrolase n=1 Tax=Pontibacter diazotrophicus TaxID=1400979 RepID=A0A3D8L9Q5_9BACT|nr:TIGR00730 family Rossman fold protein [Pontibacter diazotrophicus]RDV14107.1 TIGR00730 family Rossman fold protein [Pontibacter diazotrophicus]